LILGAGYGRRMLPITERRAKPSLPFRGVPIIRQIVERLSPITFRIGINLFYRPQDIVEALSGREVLFSLEQEILGTSGGVKKMVELFSIKDDIIVYNGDSLLFLDYNELIKFHKKNGAMVTLVVSSPRENYTRFSVKNHKLNITEDGEYIYCGAMVISSELLKEIPSGENIIKEFIVNQKIDVFPIENFLEFTNPASYLKKHGGITHIENGARVASDAIIEKSLVLKDASVSTGAVVLNSIIVSGEVSRGELIKDKIFIDGRTYPIS